MGEVWREGEESLPVQRDLSEPHQLVDVQTAEDVDEDFIRQSPLAELAWASLEGPWPLGPDLRLLWWSEWMRKYLL